MKKQIRKPISILLSLVLVLSLAFCSVLPAFSEGEEANWVKLPTSAEGLNVGDYYLDMSGLDMYKELFTEQSLFDDIKANNYDMLGREALKANYPTEWAAAVQQIKDENPGLSDDAFEDGWPCYDAEDILYATLQGYGVDTSHAAIEALGKEYAKTAYAEELAAAAVAAQAKIDELKSLDWYADLNFSQGYQWIKAEQNGEAYEEYFSQEMIEEFFTVYGANWKQIKVVASTDGLADGDAYIDQSVLDEMLEAKFVEQFGDVEEISMPDYETGTMKTVTKAEVIAQQREALGEFYVNTTAPEGNLFQYKNVTTMSTYPGAPSYTIDIIYPLADHTWSSTPFDSTFFTSNVKTFTAPTNPDTPDQPDQPDQPDTPDTPDDSGDCPYCGKTHKKIWVKIIHLLLWLFQKVVSIFTK